MQKTILITGATDGIGLETAKMLAAKGHNLLLHGRNPAKLEDVVSLLSTKPGDGRPGTYICDLSDMADVAKFAAGVLKTHDSLDVLINNAGVFTTQNPITREGLDIRFAVNTIAPYLLTKKLLPLFGPSGRVINLSSAAQAPVAPAALAGRTRLSGNLAYAGSKLALTMWSCRMGSILKDKGPGIISVNPASFLGSKMVKKAYGVAGLYFDNDAGRFTTPHPDALDRYKCDEIIRIIDRIIKVSAHPSGT